MRILHVLPEIYLGCGLSNSIFTASQAMVMKNHEVFVVAQKIDDYYKDKFNQWKIVWDFATLSQHSKNPITLYKGFKKIRKLIEFHNIDIIHTHHRWNALIGGFAARSRCVHITSDHNMLYGAKLISFKAKAVITDSQINQKHLIEYFGVDKQKIHIVPPLIEWERYNNLLGLNPDKPHKQNDLDLSTIAGGEEETILMGQIGRLSDQKGQLFLLDALPEIVKQCPKVKMLFLGSGPLESEIRKKIEDLNLTKNAFILPIMKDITFFLDKVDFMLFSSKHEGFCVAVSESIISGRPVVATNVGGIPEQITSGVNGFLYDFGNKQALVKNCIELIKDNRLREKMSKNGRDIFLKEFSYQNISNKLEKAYKDNL